MLLLSVITTRKADVFNHWLSSCCSVAVLFAKKKEEKKKKKNEALADNIKKKTEFELLHHVQLKQKLERQPTQVEKRCVISIQREGGAGRRVAG